MMAAGGAAIAALKTADGKDAGSATVTEADGALHVALTATGLPAGTHAVHIHTTGKCDAPTFETAGGPWNPTGAHHGRSEARRGGKEGVRTCRSRGAPYP